MVNIIGPSPSHIIFENKCEPIRDMAKSSPGLNINIEQTVHITRSDLIYW